MKTLLVWLKREFLQILILALPFAVVAAQWNKFPPVVATHWGIDGHANGWMPKTRGLLLPPLLNVALAALFILLPRIDPKLRSGGRGDSPRNRWALRHLRLAITAFLSLVSLMVMAIALGWPVDVGRLIFNGVLILLMVVGNFLGSLRPNFFAGIRTPWTLSDPETWRVTHRIAGRWLVFGSLALLLLQFLLSAAMQITFLIVFIGAWSVGCLVYSYVIFQRRQSAP